MVKLSVTQINTYIKACFDDNKLLRDVHISGEISNFLHYSRSGHFYFTLKDEKSQLKCVMFASNSSKLRFEPENGMHVICNGNISSYERDGIYQLYVNDIQPEGIGSLMMAYEQLKNKLEEEGLFSDLRKRSIPKYPSKIGVVTSNMGAAIQDITKILNRRFPIAQVYLYPALVQGEGSVEDIVKGIEKLNSLGDIDTIIVGRGGGSIEDLWSFNDEKVARAVANSAVPIISAVGHETDFTICDFVSDLRAATPSAAAELVVPDKYNQMVYLSSISQKLLSLVKSKLTGERMLLDSLMNKDIFQNRIGIVENQRQKVAHLQTKISSLHKAFVLKKQNELELISKLINSINPLALLNRGYSVAYNGKTLVKSKNDVSIGDKIDVKLGDGKLYCKVERIEDEYYEQKNDI